MYVLVVVVVVVVVDAALCPRRQENKIKNEG